MPTRLKLDVPFGRSLNRERRGSRSVPGLALLRAATASRRPRADRDGMVRVCKVKGCHIHFKRRNRQYQSGGPPIRGEMIDGAMKYRETAVTT